MADDPFPNSVAFGFGVNWLVESLESYSDAFERLAKNRDQVELAKNFAEFTSQAIDILTGRHANHETSSDVSAATLLEEHRKLCSDNISRVLFKSLQDSGVRSTGSDHEPKVPRCDNCGRDR